MFTMAETGDSKMGERKLIVVVVGALVIVIGTVGDVLGV
jgi:hypothetical protein